MKSNVTTGDGCSSTILSPKSKELWFFLLFSQDHLSRDNNRSKWTKNTQRLPRDCHYALYSNTEAVDSQIKSFTINIQHLLKPYIKCNSVLDHHNQYMSTKASQAFISCLCVYPFPFYTHFAGIWIFYNVCWYLLLILHTVCKQGEVFQWAIP